MYTKQITGELSFVGVGTNVAGVGFLCLCNGLTLSQTSNSDFSSLSFTPAAALAAFCTQQAEIVDPQEKTFFVAGGYCSGSILSFAGNDTPEQLQLALSLLEQGKTYRQITAMTGISKSTLIRAKTQGA